jgi:hypothetical protein
MYYGNSEKAGKDCLLLEGIRKLDSADTIL